MGGIEEFAKLVPFLLFAVRSRHFDEEIDGVVHSSGVALGFASYENYRYSEFLAGTAMAARAVASAAGPRSAEITGLDASNAAPRPSVRARFSLDSFPGLPCPASKSAQPG